MIKMEAALIFNSLLRSFCRNFFYKNTQTVTLKMNEAGTIYYTIDGNEPTIDSLIYTSGIEISSNTTLNFIGKDLAGNLSEVYKEEYVIDKIIPTPKQIFWEDGTTPIKLYNSS
jgi:hypothetical protein